MNEGKLTSVYRHHPQPGRLTYVQELSTGICAIHEDPVVALKEFDSLWAGRSPYQLFEHAPPMPKRPDDPKPASAAIEGETTLSKFIKKLAQHFHPDLTPSTKRFSATQIMQIVNQLYAETK